jgi:hypothetical protein
MNGSPIRNQGQSGAGRALRLSAKALASLVAGLLAALVLHYVLYRIGIPGTPFIYVVF